MGMNRHTDIKKNRILKASMESYHNSRLKLLKIHFIINLPKKIIFYWLIFVLLSKIWRILSNFYKIHRKDLHIL